MDVDKLTEPLLPMMPNNVSEPTVDAEIEHNVETQPILSLVLKEGTTENNEVPIDETNSDDIS